MEEWITQQNINLFKTLMVSETDPDKLRQLQGLLDEHLVKLAGLQAAEGS